MKFSKIEIRLPIVINTLVYSHLNSAKEHIMSFKITNPFTGLAMEKTPDGTSLKDVTFSSKEEAMKFFSEHGGNPVEIVEVPIK